MHCQYIRARVVVCARSLRGQYMVCSLICWPIAIAESASIFGFHNAGSRAGFGMIRSGHVALIFCGCESLSGSQL